MTELLDALAKAQDIGIMWIVLGVLGYISYSLYKESKKNHADNVEKIGTLNARIDTVEEEKSKCYTEVAVLLERQTHLTKRFEECVAKMQSRV